MKRGAIGTLSKDVEQNIGIDRHYLVPYGLDKGCLLTNSSFVPYTLSYELVGIRENPHLFVEGHWVD